MNFREHLNTLEEARDMSVPTEWRIGLGNAQRFYGDKHNSGVSQKEFDVDMERIAKQLKIKEVQDFVRWMETKMSFTLPIGIPIKEAIKSDEEIYAELLKKAKKQTKDKDNEFISKWIKTNVFSKKFADKLRDDLDVMNEASRSSLSKDALINDFGYTIIQGSKMASENAEILISAKGDEIAIVSAGKYIGTFNAEKLKKTLNQMV